MFWWDRERPWTILVPPLTGGALMLGFFWLTNRWSDLENPVQGQVALVCGIAGFLAGIALQRITNWVLAGLSGAVALALIVWAYLQPHDTPEDEEFRQILAVLAVVAVVTATALNLPQILRGRRRPPDEEAA
jgi:membrane associated rhomboid family serine protease